MEAFLRWSAEALKGTILLPPPPPPPPSKLRKMTNINFDIDTKFVVISSTFYELWTGEDSIAWWAETRGTVSDALSTIPYVGPESISYVNS